MIKGTDFSVAGFLVVVLAGPLLIGQPGPRAPMKITEEDSASYRWLQKSVEKSRLLDDMEDLFFATLCLNTARSDWKYALEGLEKHQAGRIESEHAPWVVVVVADNDIAQRREIVGLRSENVKKF